MRRIERRQIRLVERIPGGGEGRGVAADGGGGGGRGNCGGVEKLLRFTDALGRRRRGNRGGGGGILRLVGDVVKRKLRRRVLTLEFESQTLLRRLTSASGEDGRRGKGRRDLMGGRWLERRLHRRLSLLRRGMLLLLQMGKSRVFREGQRGFVTRLRRPGNGGGILFRGTMDLAKKDLLINLEQNQI